MNANKLAYLISMCGDGSYNQDAATMLLQQQDEIDALKKLKADADALDKKLLESIKKSNEAWNNATKSILKKAKE